MYSDRRFPNSLPRRPEEVDVVMALRVYRVVQVLTVVVVAGFTLGIVLA